MLACIYITYLFELKVNQPDGDNLCECISLSFFTLYNKKLAEGPQHIVTYAGHRYVVAVVYE